MTYEGPVTLRADQLQAGIDLANRVFRHSGGGDMGREYPLIFHPQRLEQLRVFLHQGQPVSLVSSVISDVVLLGCSVRMSLIGAVCTDKAHRGQELAGRLVDDAVERAKAVGAALMLISGGRSLYTRRAAVGCGRFLDYRLNRGQVTPRLDGVQLQELSAENCADVLRLYENEAIRFRRDAWEYAIQVAGKSIVNRPGWIFAVRRDGRPVAALAGHRRKVAKDDPAEMLCLCEQAGCRRTALWALAAVAERMGLTQLLVSTYAQDPAAWAVMSELGAAATPVSFGGTVKVLDADRLWRDFSPLIAERLGHSTAKELRISAQSDNTGIHTLTFHLGSQSLTLQGAERIMKALFGSKDADALADLTGPVAEVMRKALPLPLPMYGMNYA